MPKLKRLSAPEVVSILRGFGFGVLTQTGSHLKLRRVHTGTCHAIFRQASRYISVEELRPHFYSL